jgi:hypothetical protein
MSHDVLQAKRGSESQSAESVTSEAPGGSRLQFKGDGAIPPVGAAFQAKEEASASDAGYGDAGTHQVAAAGVAGAGSELPHKDKIAASFGAEHAGSLDGIKAHVGGDAATATGALGAQAYATGNSVAFGKSPDLHTAAHEAAHVVQQKQGVSLKAGVGQAGDSYERNADEVADRVVQGKSATDLLPQGGGAGGDQAVQSKEIQFLGHELGKPLPTGAAKPEHGEDADQRRYSREQYQEMWEKEQGKKLSRGEKETIERGCIGLTANNIAGGGNPLDHALKVYGTFEQAHAFMAQKNQELHAQRADPATARSAPEGEYIMFAKMFWSNQADGDNSAPDDKAFRPDPKTGEVDMSGYDYKAQPGFVNFDYGWWDDKTTSFWHANHMEYKDPDKRKKNPMKVYQSTKDKFIAGYTDFDRVVFGVALATNYDPGMAAMTGGTGSKPPKSWWRRLFGG